MSDPMNVDENKPTSESSTAEKPTSTSTINDNRMMLISHEHDDDDLSFSKKVPYRLVKHCVALKDMIDDMDVEDEDSPIPISPQGNFSEKHFDSVMEYCEFMCSSDFPERKDDGKIEGEPTDWEKGWSAKFEKEFIFELIMISTYLGINPLCEFLCWTVAQMIKDKSPEEIRELFNIKDDFTDEEKAKILEENSFIKEATTTS